MFKFDKKIWNYRIRKTVIVALIAPLFNSVASIPTAQYASAAPVGSGRCEQNVGSATGVSVTTSDLDCIVTFTNTTQTTWTAPAGVKVVRVLVVGAGASGDRGVCSVYWGHGGGGGQVLDTRIAVNPATAYNVRVGVGGPATEGCPASTTSPRPKGNAGTSSIFASLTANGGSAATNTSSTGGTSGSGFIGGDTGAGSLPGYGGGGAGGRGVGLDGGPGLNSDISGSTIMYGSGGAGKSTEGFGTAYSGGAVNSIDPIANRGGGGADKATNGAWLTSTPGADGVVIIRYTNPYSITYNGNGATSTRSIETTSAITTNASTTLSNGKLAQGTIVSSGLLFNLNAADSSSVVNNIWYDSNRNGVSGTIYGSPTYNSEQGFFQLNGSNQFINLGTSALPASGTTPFTASVMFKHGLPNVSDKAIMARWGNGIDGGFIIRTNSTSSFSAYRSGYGELTTTNKLDAGDVNYGTVTYDGTTYKMYQNGVLRSSGAAGSMTVTADLILGGRGHGSSAETLFTGQIYSAQGYSRALTADEVLQNYNALLPNQIVSKTGFTLGQWNTEANGTGTQYESATVVDIEVLKTPYLRLKPENYSVSGSTKTWTATNGASISDAGTTKIKGTPVVNLSGGGSFGATATFPTLSGDTSAGIKFGNADLPTYTFCGVARYKGTATSLLGTQRRIFASPTLDWITGFYQDGMGANHHHNGWVTSYVTTTKDVNWHYFCDSGNGTMWDGVHIPTEHYRATTYLPSMSINYGYEGQTSDWEVAEIIIYDEYLPKNQIDSISRYFKNRFGIAAGATTVQAAAAVKPITNYAATSDRILQAQWISKITYDGNGQDKGRAPVTHIIKNSSGTLATNTGNLTKGGYKLVGWNTAADGTGTRYALGATYANLGDILLYAQWSRNISFPQAIIDPNSLAPWGRYKASDYVSGTSWADSSGNGRNAIISGTAPTVITTTASVANGNTTSFKAIDGVPATKILFNNPYMADGNYTLFHVARHDVGTNGRIFNSVNDNWLSGFYGAWSGVKHYDAWLTTQTDRYDQKWVMSTDYGRGYRSNGDYSVTSASGVDDFGPLAVNGDPYGQTSDFNIAEVIIYDRKLTLDEMRLVEDYLANTYGIAGYTNYGTYLTTSTLSIGAGVGGRSDTFTATNGLGNKSFALSPVVSGITLDTSTANGVALVVSSLVPSGTYVETITATDQAGFTAQHVVTVTVSPAVKFDTSTATSIVTTSGRGAQLRLNTVNGIGTKVFTMSQTSVVTSTWITLDTSTAASGYATLKVDTYTAPGNYTVSIVVTDSTKLRSTYIVTITVNAPPTLVSTSPLTTAPVLSDLRVNLDAGNINSYSGSGSTWTDLSGNGRNGTLQSSPTFSNSNGGILNFNGSSQYVTVPSVRSELFTVEAWVKFNALGTSNYPCVVTNQYSSNKINYAICFWNGSSIRAGYHQSGDGWLGNQTGAFTPTIGTWYQLVYKVEKVGNNYIGSLYQNGNLVPGQTTSTIAPGNDQSVDLIGRQWNSGVYINGSIPIVRIYSRALSNAEIIQNYNATSPRFLSTPTNSVTLTTTQGVATSTSLYYAGLGTGTKTFTATPSVPGVTLDTSTVNTVKVNFANTLQSTDSATARVITQTVTAYDSTGQAATTPVYVSATINPPIIITPTTPTTLTTTFGVTAYDTFTATRGMGGPYTFSVQSSAYQSAFTMTKPSANVGLLTVANNLPAGTYYETITATDSATASTTYLLTVIVNPAMTLTAAGSSTLTTTITKSASMRVNVANGTGAKTMTISSPHAGITLDSSTVGSGYATINVGTSLPANTYSVTLTIRDSTGSTTTGTFTVVVNKWPRIGPPSIASGDLKINLDGSTYSGSGQWLDSSGNGLHGTLGSASTTPVGTAPLFDSESGGFFDYSTNTQQIKTNSLGSMETFTVSAWLKMPATTFTGNPGLISEYAATSSSSVNFTIQALNGKLVGGYRRGSTWSTAMTGFTPDLNTWMNVTYVVAKNGTNSYSNRLYKNGVLQESITSTSVPEGSGGGLILGRRWDLGAATYTGEIGGVTVYNRSLSAAEIIQNYNAQGFRFLATTSGTSTYTTTQGLGASISGVVASEGSGTKTFVISPVQTGITLDTSVANRYSLNIASTLEATDSSTAKTYYETVTATDSTTASTTLAYTINVNPPVRLTVTTDTVTTTSGIAAFDTFTATLGTGNKTFTLTGSPTTSGFTLTQANNVAVLKVEPTANPGTYFETVTATDSLGATTSKMIRVVVAPGPTLTGSNNLVSARGIAFVSPVYAVANGIAPYTYSLTSRAVSPDTNTVAGITFDTATMTLRVSAAVGAGTYLETITVRDVNGATSNYLINLEVKPPVVLSGSMSITKTYGDLTVSNYTTSAGIPPFTFTTSTPSVTNVCVPMKGTFIGDGTNGTLGVSYTYEKIVGTERCNWIAPNGVTSVDYAVVGGGGGGGNGRGGGGGGGGVATGTGLSITSGSFYDIAVAGGGSATNDGNDSWIRSGDLSTMYVYASGGGAGGSMSADLGTITGNNGRSAASATASSAGGSGGGGGNNYHNFTAPGTSWTGDPGSGGTGTASGFAGGGSYRCSTSANSQDGNSSAGGNGGRTTGGGGGAGGAGIGYSGSCPTYSASQAPNGGAGVVSRLTGSAETYGGGGGGADGRTEATSESIYKSSGRGLGNGGGGNGQTYRQPDGTILASALVATSGDYNTGGGGGGGISSAGNGGSGVVVLRYVTPVADSQTVTMNTVSNGVASAGSVTLTIPENTPVGSITSKTIRVVQTGGATTDYTINVTINKATPTVALSLPGSVATAQYGTPVTISAAASTAGNVLFKYGNTNITACSAVATSAGVASCSWTPNALGVTTLKATLTPTDTTNYNNSNEATFAVTVGKADTLTVTASNESFVYTGSTALVTGPFSHNGLVSIDTLTSVMMVYSGTANDGTVVQSGIAPTSAGIYQIIPQTEKGGISEISSNYKAITVVPGTLTINRAPNTSSLVYPTVNTNSAVTSPPATNYITFRPGLTDTPTTSSRLGNGVITYATSTPSNCSVDSSTAVMSLIEAGSCVVEMTVAEGDNYLADSATATITIAKGDRTISLSSTTSTLKYTDTATVVTAISYGALDGTITYSLNSSPGCSFDALGGILTATSGTLACTLNATIAEGTNFLTATTASALSMTIAKADAPIIVMDTVTAVDYSPGNRAAISPTYTISGFKGTDAASSLTLTYSFVSNPFETFSYSDTRTPIDAGTYRITPSAIVMSSGLATNYETPNYAGAAINFTVNRIAQDPVTIDGVNGEVSVPFTLVYRGGNNPTATATFTKVSGASCTVTGNGLNATEAGLCVVTVTVPGNRNYLAITSDSITVRVRNFTLVPVFVFGNGTTGITIAPNTTLTVGETACTSGCVPTLTGISPYAGAEGDVITLTGTNFTGALRVIFNVFTNATTFNVDSDTQITVQVPAGLNAGEGTLEVVTPGGITARWFDFEVLP